MSSIDIPDFEPETLPWVDKPDFESELKRRLFTNELSDPDAHVLREWRDKGILVVPKLIPEYLIDALLDHYERVWRERPVCRVQLQGSSCFLSDLTARPGAGCGARVLDLHNTSEAGKAIMLFSPIINFVKTILEDTPVGMQSLFFEYGSEQALHQDFVYVTSNILSHLIGVWIALEDVGPEQGPLLYVPRSHHIQKFDLGGGKLIFDETNRQASPKWYRHLNSEIERLSLIETPFIAKKGDVVFWHSALIHGGSPILCKERTRKSFVIHYSSRKAYARDYRNKELEPEVFESNGGVTYRWNHPNHVENYYTLP